MNQFWMVWCPSRNPPAARHDSEQSATNEAERLARSAPGEQFFVLEAIGLRTVDSMQRLDLRKGGSNDIPF